MSDLLASLAERVGYLEQELPRELQNRLDEVLEELRAQSSDTRSIIEHRSQEADARFRAGERQLLASGERMSTLSRNAVALARAVSEMHRDMISQRRDVLDLVEQVKGFNDQLQEVNRNLIALSARLPPGPEPTC